MGDSVINSVKRGVWLASQSPRRRALLAQLGFEPVVRVSEIPEFPAPGEGPVAYTERLAMEKGRAVRDGLTAQERAGGPGWMLAADTTVFVDGVMLEKPQGVADARRMLMALSGREHEVVTGVWLGDVEGEVEVVRSARTAVRFRTLSEQEVARYVATGEPMDKAGAYGIQSLGAFLVEGIRGSYPNVVGLPTTVVLAMMREVGALGEFPFLDEEGA